LYPGIFTTGISLEWIQLERKVMHVCKPILFATHVLQPFTILFAQLMEGDIHPFPYLPSPFLLSPSIPLVHMYIDHTSVMPLYRLAKLM
jgi:hypothetical protein